MTKFKFEPIFHLAKRTDINWKRAWLIRIGAFVLSIVACAVVSTLLTGRGMDFFFKNFFGAFNTPKKAWNLFHDTAILLIIALAVTPCFKMRFWNIGGEGQILMGALGSAVIITFMGGNFEDPATIITSLVLAVAFGIVWAVIPALFKAKWNTNETLLTLMMNYISVCLVDFFIKSVATSGTGTLTFTSGGVVGPIAGNEFILKIIVVAIVTIFMVVYLKYSKHGYELAVVGESEKTARYIGINTKKVIIRTLILCGAICGITGFLLVSATNHSISSGSTVGGRGFTGVLISWLGHFNPLGMLLCSFLFVFIDRGATQVSTYARLGASYPDMMTGIFFFFIVATEFFINYKILPTHHFKKKSKAEEVEEDTTETEQTEGDAEAAPSLNENVVEDTNNAVTEAEDTATPVVENTKEVE